MKRATCLIYFIVLFICLPTLSLGQGYSGQWLGTVSESINRCKGLGKAEPGDYKLTIIHDNADITIMENVVQRPYTGVVNPDRPKKVHVQGSYAEDGGYVTELVNIEFADENNAEGQSVWRWSDGYYECGGRFAFTLKKIRGD